MVTSIEELTVAERIKLVEDIWDTIADEPNKLPITDAQCAELDRRLHVLQCSPQEGSTWKAVKMRLTSKNRAK